MLLYVHRDHKDYQGRPGAQDGRLDFHTAPELWDDDDDVADRVYIALLSAPEQTHCAFAECYSK